MKSKYTRLNKLQGMRTLLEAQYELAVSLGNVTMAKTIFKDLSRIEESIHMQFVGARPKKENSETLKRKSKKNKNDHKRKKAKH